MAPNIIDLHLANIKNKDVTRTLILRCKTTALVRPIYKKDDRNEIKN